jgi:hypothetical protein
MSRSSYSVTVQGQLLRVGVEARGVTAQVRCHFQLRQSRRIGREHVRFCDVARQIVRQHHP